MSRDVKREKYAIETEFDVISVSCDRCAAKALPSKEYVSSSDMLGTVEHVSKPILTGWWEIRQATKPAEGVDICPTCIVAITNFIRSGAK